MAARSFRMYGKKRGHRRTGSEKLGSAGEALALAGVLALGIVFAVFLVRMPVLPEWRANRDFVETSGVAKATRVGDIKYGDQFKFRAEVLVQYMADGATREHWTYDITFDSSYSYSVDRASRVALIQVFTPGESYPVWYDPRNPDSVVIVRGYSGWLWSLLSLPLTLIVIGGGGLVLAVTRWGKSAEHLAAATQLADRLDLLDEITTASKDFPNVPRDENLTNSPGTRLKYRLPINTTQGWQMAMAVIVAVVWNAIVLGFVVLAVSRAVHGPERYLDVPLVLFILPFLGIGIWFVYYLFRQALIATGVGPTQLEISDHPLFPGRHYDLFLTHGGRLTMDYIDVEMVCEEQATFRQGTDTRSESRDVFRQQIFRRERIDIPNGMAFEQQCRIEVPQSAMHSFHADHNVVMWKFVIRGQTPGWPAFERVFPIIVYPQPRLARAI